jgi:hypothetical protein
MLALALYKCHLGVAGWGGTKEQKAIIEKLRFADALF